ncbi:MAG: HAMP domain-containing sensor histidine kinase [Elusimicrobiales bacterium]
MKLYNKLLATLVLASLIPVMVIVFTVNLLNRKYLNNALNEKLDQYSNGLVPPRTTGITFDTASGNIISESPASISKQALKSIALNLHEINRSTLRAEFNGVEHVGACFVKEASIAQCVFVPQNDVEKNADSITNWIILASLFSGFVSVFLIVYLTRFVTQPLEALIDYISSMKPSDDFRFQPTTTMEINTLVDKLAIYHSRLEEYQKIIAAHAKETAIAETAAQVAHDIRSPLAALDMAVKGSAHIPEDERIIIRAASSRIHDIANNLIEQNRAMKSPDGQIGEADSSSAESPSAQLLSSLIEPLITEKRLQFRSKIGIEIDGGVDTASYGLFASVQPTEFKRLISNLINNAVEVLDDKGRVSVRLAQSGGKISVSVSDNGKGIPPGILAKLGQRGETHGKKGGSGLGIFHAKQSAEGWGGGLEIASEIGKGTTVTVTLPLAPPPDWFVSVLTLSTQSAVVILDDDASIHQIWKGRLESAQARANGIEEFHFSTPDEIRAFVKTNPKAGNAAYLFDYELLGFAETGLSLADELGLGSQVTLVTSRYDEPRIMEECARLKIRLIPKGLSALVPISIVATEQKPVMPETQSATAVGKTAVLVDDDPLVHMTWKMAAKANGITLKTYKNPDGLMADYAMLDLAIPIYIDSELGDNVKGEDIAQTLHDKGFTNLFMETGHPPDKFARLTFLKNVQSKEPPWQ